MARIRTIKPGFFRHAALYDAEVETGLPLRIAFAGLWTVADREGRFRWQPRELKLDALPHDLVDFSRVLDALTTRGFIVRYASPDGEVGAIPSWSKHQVVNNREVASELPPPPKTIRKAEQKHNTPDASATREARVSDAPRDEHMHASGEQEQEQEREGNRNGEEDSSLRSPDAPAVKFVPIVWTDVPIFKPISEPVQQTREAEIPDFLRRPPAPLHESERESINALPEADRARLAYAKIAEGVGWPDCRDFTGARRTAITKRIEQCGGFRGWCEMLTKAGNSDFLTGKTDKPFRPTGIDWFLKPANITKILEGAYDNRANTHAKRGTDAFDEGARVAATYD